MRIAFVSLYAGMRTGAGKRVANLASAFASHGEDVLLCYQLDGSHIRHESNLELEKIPSLHTRPLPPVPYPDLLYLNTIGYAWLIRRLKSFSADTIEFQQNQPTLLADHHGETVVVIHGSIVGLAKLSRRPLTPLVRLRGALEERELRHAKRVVVVSDFVRREVIHYFRIPAEKILTVPNGADTDVFHPSRDSYERLHSRFGATHLLLAVGRLAEEKAYERLIEAFARLKAEQTSCKLIILGSGNPHTLQTLARKKDVASDVTFGYEPDQSRLADFYAGADVYIHPSRYDAAPLSVVEAMASGTVVLASRAGGIPEVLDGTGVLLSDTQPETIAREVNKLLQDSALRRNLTADASVRIEKHFTWDRIADRYAKLLQSNALE